MPCLPPSFPTYQLVPVRPIPPHHVFSLRIPHPHSKPFCPEPSRLILHFSTPSPLRDLILTPRLSPTLAHITVHPPALLSHLATAQLTPPPPLSTPDRFWRVFAPLAARAWEVERIVLGPGGAGPNDDGEMVLEVLTRAPEGRGRNVERELEGWTPDGPCSLSELDSLRPILEEEGKRRRDEVSNQLPSLVRFIHRWANGLFGWIATYVRCHTGRLVQFEPHTGTAEISCQSASSLCPQRHVS